ncbi:MAG: aminopeptidase [Candidatus Aegiribacteria sp.]|nr:aminopeptidase [Candidatus Aegiribacteria sp.]
MDLDALRRKYAEIVVKTAINLQEGEPLLIRAEVVQREFSKILAEVAYSMGASSVSLQYTDPELIRLRIDKTLDGNNLKFMPSHLENMYDCYLKDGWSSISLRGPESPDIMEGADPVRLGKFSRANSIVMRKFLKGISSNRIAWNVCLHPTEAWAAKVLGSSENWEKRIWEVLVPILRLDRDDPAGAWLDHDTELKRRCGHMNRARYDRIHFTGPDTDLYIGMAPDRVFAGGRCVNQKGVEFFPNIPTEEIFSTPDHTRTEGFVKTTRPVEVLGTQVTGAWFRFSAGQVVEFGADTNREMLEQYLNFAAGARALGEVALVDVNSPIFRSGKIFYNILFDENAACHIALGNGYPDCIENGTRMSDDELKETRCNSSLVHTDFMIGSEDISAFGVKQDGSEEKIIEHGLFVI